MDEETQRLLDIRQAKLRRLRVLEVQQAQYGNDCPPHITIEVEGLRRALGLVDAAVASPVTSDIVEELGQSGRFMATDTRLSHIERSIARLTVQLESFIEDSMQWRGGQRGWLIIITIAIVFVLMVVVAVVTYIAAKGGV